MSDYTDNLLALSNRLVEAQKPIRVLDSIKWDDDVREAFFASGCKEQPAVDADYYAQQPLPFDAAEKQREFLTLERQIVRELGSFNPLGNLLRRMCREYRDVVRLLESRGTPDFSAISQELFGSTYDAFHAGETNLADLGRMMTQSLTNIDESVFLQDDSKEFDAEQAVAILQERFDAYFTGSPRRVRVMLSDGIIADAAAGADYLKMRSDARFSERDLRALEIHEGWVHLGTTINGAVQPVCTFLSKGPPSSTVTQEGLAILMEILAFASYPRRIRRLTNRINGIQMAEDGATFRDVFRYFRDQGLDDDASWTNAVRIYRGSTATGGPFTKDLTYSKGFILVYNFVEMAVRKGRLDRIPLLFCGKATLEDNKVLAQAVDEGIVVPPRFLPPQIADLHALSAWMCYSSFLNNLDRAKVEIDYSPLF